MAQKQNSTEPKPNGFIAKPSYLSPASEDTLPRVPTKKTRASPMSEVSSQSKSVMDIFKPFIHNGSVSYQVIHLTPYRSRFEKNWSPQS